MKKVFLLALVFVLSASINNLYAQDRFAVSLKMGYGTGAYEAAGTGISKGKFAFRIGASYAIIPILDGYMAYSRTGFTCGENSGGFCNTAPVDFTTSGFKAGFRLNHGPNANVWIPWLRAGFVYGMLNISQISENFDYSDSGIGFEMGAGLAYPVTKHVKIVPAFNYTRYSITGANGIDQAVVVLTALIGVRYGF